ncbi:hypothetical protein B0H34DRAFT_811105 [Crassisporium funariophilum]|nr:hypothetical protein B0H34DRAFT_811105 [Crassisporium funariophilum]
MYSAMEGDPAIKRGVARSYREAFPIQKGMSQIDCNHFELGFVPDLWIERLEEAIVEEHTGSFVVLREVRASPGCCERSAISEETLDIGDERLVGFASNSQPNVSASPHPLIPRLLEREMPVTNLKAGKRLRMNAKESPEVSDDFVDCGLLNSTFNKLKQIMSNWMSINLTVHIIIKYFKKAEGRVDGQAHLFLLGRGLCLTSTSRLRWIVGDMSKSSSLCLKIWLT